MNRLLVLTLLLAVPSALHAQIGETADDGDAAFDGSAPAGTVDADPVDEAPAAAPASVADSSASMADFEEAPDPNVVDAAPTPDGPTGVMRTYQAGGLRPGTLGLFLQLEYFNQKGFVRADNDARRFLGHIGLSWTPIEYVEAFATLSSRAVSNSQGNPELIQSVGDVSFGAKGFYAINDAFSAGALFRILMPAGANQVGLDLSAVSADIIALSSLDLRGIADVPLRFNLNIGYLIDNSANLFPFTLDRVERFGQGVYDYDRIFVGLSADAPLRYVTPFVEWTLEWPNGANCDANIDLRCVGQQRSVSGGELSPFATYPNWITLGARTQPVNGLSFNVGMDIGVTTAQSQGTPDVPGWNFLIGAAYNLDPSGQQVVEVPVEVPVGVATSYVEGVVRDAATQEPIEGARITYLETTYTDQITGVDGAFRTFDFEPGTELTIEISHPEFDTRAMRLSITEEVLSGSIDLERAYTNAAVSGRVNTTGPADVVVSFRGAQRADAEADENGDYSVELEPGTYTIYVQATGHETVIEEREFGAGPVQAGYSLGALPPDAGFRRVADGMVFADETARVDFDATGALTPAATALLDLVAVELERVPDQRILVRAHTDPRETIDEELTVTALRADAVIAYLVGKGLAEARFEPDGVGAAEPLFPNVTDRNRRQNNRIEFQFID